jgi:hypothetical protein
MYGVLRVQSLQATTRQGRAALQHGAGDLFIVKFRFIEFYQQPPEIQYGPAKI